jgi:hypothetical protein
MTPLGRSMDKLFLCPYGAEKKRLLALSLFFKKWSHIPASGAFLSQMGKQFAVALCLLMPMAKLITRLFNECHHLLRSPVVSKIRHENNVHQSPQAALPQVISPPVSLEDVPYRAFERIAWELDASDLDSLSQVSRLCAEAVSSSSLWMGFAHKFSLQVFPCDAQSTMQRILTYFALDAEGGLKLRYSNPSESLTTKALTSFPQACWVMLPGSEKHLFHFCFRTPTGDVRFLRDVSSHCRLSQRFIAISKILNDERYRSIKA